MAARRCGYIGCVNQTPEPAEALAVSLDDIAAASRRIAGHVRCTPLLRLPGAALGLDIAELWLKLEHLQRGGSFKARGMFNRMLAQPIPAAGVVVASGGNAGIAVATAARALGVACEVFLPGNSTAAKRAALAALGAAVQVRGEAYADALAACLQRQAETGALLMHAYDQPEVVAGAGTLAAEIEDQAGLPDRVLVSVGGGGLVPTWGATVCASRTPRGGHRGRTGHDGRAPSRHRECDCHGHRPQTPQGR